MTVTIGRRELLVVLGGAAAWPLAARAQQREKMRRIGVLMNLSPDDAEGQAPSRGVPAGVAGSGLGCRPQCPDRAPLGRGRHRALSQPCRGIGASRTGVILAAGGIAAQALQRVSRTIPIVFANAADPVGMGVVASLARPGGNVTGLSVQSNELAGKRIELLREVVPGLRRLAILGNVGNPFTVLELAEVQAAAGALGLDVDTLEIRSARDIAPAFDRIKGRSEALYVCVDGLMSSNRIPINILAVGARLPTMHGAREYVEGGGLMSFGANYPDLFRRSADYVDKILRGAKPANIPVEQPTKFDLIVNLNTARALNIAIPSTLLALADEVIE